VPGGVGLLVENAEQLPLESKQLRRRDLGVPLPRAAARRAPPRDARDLARARRRRRFVVCDSLQRSDAQEYGLADFSEWFPAAYHEPYYKGYCATT